MQTESRVVCQLDLVAGELDELVAREACHGLPGVGLEELRAALTRPCVEQSVEGCVIVGFERLVGACQL